jgi:glycosyltransferase involved in cell wall biosynthesis
MIYGSAELLPAVKEEIDADHQLRNSVTLVGAVENKDLGNWYSAADFIVSASHHEGSGIAVIEAMSCGCIPIVTNIPSFQTMTDQGRCGFLYAPGDADALAEVMQNAASINIPAWREKVRTRFLTEFSFSALADKIIALADKHRR